MAALGKLHCSFAANDERQQWAGSGSREGEALPTFCTVRIL
jgi:hypothetical protein